MATTGNLTGLGRAVARLANASLAARDRPRLEQRMAEIHQTLGCRRAARGRRRWLVVCLSIGIAVAASVLLWLRSQPVTAAPGAPSSSCGTGSMPPDGTLPIRLTDGTQVMLGPETKGRVVREDTRGVSLELQRGSMCIDVTPGREGTWAVRGGPFELHTAGARFDAKWDPASGWFDVTMYEGEVSVRGECLQGERALTEGQSEMFSCTSRWKSKTSLVARARAPGDPGERGRLCN